MEKIIWTNCVRNEEVLQRTKRAGISYRQQKEGILTGLVTSGIGGVFLKHVIEGKVEGRIEGTGRRGR